VAFPKVAAGRKATEKGAQAKQSKTSTTGGSVTDFHFQAEFTFLMGQVWLDTEEGTA